MARTNAVGGGGSSLPLVAAAESRPATREGPPPSQATEKQAPRTDGDTNAPAAVVELSSQAVTGGTGKEAPANDGGDGERGSSDTEREERALKEREAENRREEERIVENTRVRFGSAGAPGELSFEVTKRSSENPGSEQVILTYPEDADRDSTASDGAAAEGSDAVEGAPAEGEAERRALDAVA